MANLVENKKWIKVKNADIEFSKDNTGLVIENNSDKSGIICFYKAFRRTGKELKIEFYGEALYGPAPALKVVDGKMKTNHSIMLNSKAYISFAIPRLYMIAISVQPQSKAVINCVEYEEQESYIDEKLSSFNRDILLLSPSYPSIENEYLSGFVHSRNKEYKQHGLDADVAIVYESYSNSCKYQFEGVDVTRLLYSELRILLGEKKYKKILIHFFDEKYFDVLEGCDLSETEIYIWVHGPETLYWDFPYFTTKYYSELNELTDYQKELFKKRDAIIRKINEKVNVKFVFVSEWIKKRSEELINIKFNNYVVIPNVIDTTLFDYQEKNENQMKKVFMLRRYDDINKYAVDVSVKTILELSKRNVFKELEFNIYGRGDAFDLLFNPIKEFSNVHFYKKFYTHQEISQLHKENGIALFPTRYDAQGVSMCEAGSSGLLVVSSDNEAIKEFIPFEDGNIIETENYKEYANFIERVIHNKDLFHKITKETRDKIVEKCSYESTVAEEIKLIEAQSTVPEANYGKSNGEDPILTIVVPSYNVSSFILKTLKSLVTNNENAGKMEVLIVNDGSKDNTSKVVKRFIENEAADLDIFKLIDKENGGHGSTINVGISNAHGKYLRVIDGDDWVNTSDLEKLIAILENEESDIVITDYCEDMYYNNTVNLRPRKIYSFMEPGKQYRFDELCGRNGFGEWGPVLATANIKLSKLKEADFKLSEKSFYVDMEYNAFYLPVIETVKYYDLDIYRYYIGRAQQSTNIKTFSKRDNQHRNVIINILEFAHSTDMSPEKKSYIYNKVVGPMITLQYGYLARTANLKLLKSFDKQVKALLPKKEYIGILTNRTTDKMSSRAKTTARKVLVNDYTYKLARNRMFSTGFGKKVRDTLFYKIVKRM